MKVRWSKYQNLLYKSRSFELFVGKKSRFNTGCYIKTRYIKMSVKILVILCRLFFTDRVPPEGKHCPLRIVFGWGGGGGGELTI